MAGSSDARPVVLVTLGTDHHPFGRLLEWVARWERRPEVDLVVQAGMTPVPDGLPFVPFLEHRELLQVMSRATAVVTHGGASTIVESRRHGTKPIVVPRLKRFGEVVDDHQVHFCDRLAQLGQVLVAHDEPALHRALDLALVEPLVLRASGEYDEIHETVQRFDGLVTDLLARRRRDRRVPVERLIRT